MTLSSLPELYHISLADTGITVRATSEQSVLEALERFGRPALGVGCRNGGCGVCRVLVLEGRVRAGKMSMRHVNSSDRAAGYALACRIYPASDLVVRASPGNPRSAAVSVQDPKPR